VRFLTHFTLGKEADFSSRQPLNTMPIIAVLNRKGGSGKSTLATNLAGWFAARGQPVMLGDMDRQQSVRGWVQRRDPQAGLVSHWRVDTGGLLRTPIGVSGVIVDTPGALYGYPLSKLLAWVDAVVVPVGPSVFDHDAGLSFLQELESHPRLASGRCKLAVVGMRWPQEKVNAWHASGRQWDVSSIAAIPEHALYGDCLETGTSVFERADSQAKAQQAQWQPLIDWLDPIWRLDTRKAFVGLAPDHPMRKTTGMPSQTVLLL
jgi:chromosome partitioning protein